MKLQHLETNIYSPSYPLNKMARGIPYTGQICRYNSNGNEFKNNLMDQMLKQLGIERIFSAPTYPQSNSKLEVFHKYLKPPLKKLCEKDLSNWDQYLNQVLTSYRVTPNLATAEMPFFWCMEGIQIYPFTNYWNLCSDS